MDGVIEGFFAFEKDVEGGDIELAVMTSTDHEDGVHAFMGEFKDVFIAKSLGPVFVISVVVGCPETGVAMAYEIEKTAAV